MGTVMRTALEGLIEESNAPAEFLLGAKAGIKMVEAMMNHRTVLKTKIERDLFGSVITYMVGETEEMHDLVLAMIRKDLEDYVSAP